MERQLKWTIVQIVIFLTLKVHNYSCQHNQQATAVLSPLPIHKEFTKEYLSAKYPSPTLQLMNTLLTIAAANGVLPELLPKVQPLQIVDTPYSAQDEHRNIAATPMQQPMVLRQHESIPHAPPISTEPFAHATAGYDAVSRPPPIVPPIVISPGLNTQTINPFVLEMPRPVYQPKEELCFCSDHMASGPPSLPMININTFDASRSNVDPACANSILTTENGVQYPVNLQISIPPPNVEAPRITLINALPTSTGSRASTDVNSASYNNWFPCGYASQPQQVIVKKRKSSLNDWLPLIIYSMLNKERGGCSGRCCCCPCKSKRGSTVPVPYPIPIPTNCPIIGTGYSPHNTTSTKNDHHSHHHDD